jgi:uncharacterized protein (UPF0332 family)
VRCVVAEFAPAEVLQRVGTATKRNLTDWQEGISIESRSGKSLEVLRHRATADRLALAAECRNRARRLENVDPPMYRDAISRYYYCLYHAFRAAVYFVAGGDDHQEHKALPGAISDSFPDVDQWRNVLKTARLLRNAADYTAYPKAESRWRADCASLSNDVDRALIAIRAFLRQEGWRP